MAHLKKSATTGHLLKTGTGHLTKGCNTCTNCSSIGTQARMVVSSLAWCLSGCEGWTPGGGVTYTLSNTGVAIPSGTYDLNRATDCVYTTTASCSIPYYNNAFCSGSPAGYLTYYTFYIGFTATEIIAKIVIGDVGVGELTLFSGTYSISSPYDCTATRTISNNLTSSNCQTLASPNYIGKDGSVDVSMI